MTNKRIIVNVEGDLPIRCRVFLKINGKDFVIFSDEKDNSFEIENDTGIVEIEIKKENIWKTESKATIFITSLLDLIMGIFAGTGSQGDAVESLPFGIDYTFNTTVDDYTVYSFKLSEYMSIDEEKVPDWERFVTIEVGVAFALVVAVMVLLGIIFKGFIGILLMIAAIPLAAVIAVVGRSNVLNLLDTLKFGFAPKKIDKER